MSTPSVRVAVVIVTWNGEPWIQACLQSVASQDRCANLVVVDNGSRDGTLKFVEANRATLHARGTNLTVESLDANCGFPSAANRGLRTVLDSAEAADAILLLNQDTVLEPGCLAAFAEELEKHPRAGCLGAKTLYPDGRIQHAGGYLDRPRMVGRHYGHHEDDRVGSHDEVREVEFVTGAAMLVRRAALTEVGLFNEVFSPGYYEDLELCGRIRDRGWQVLFTPSARVLHHESTSFPDDLERLRLAHRNRLVYLLPQLEDPGFEDVFMQAEVEFLEHDAMFNEIRAINLAALDLLADVSDLIARRFAGAVVRSSVPAAARRMALELRAACRALLVTS
jgi:GT2 family glycosyltransferase